MKEQSKAYHKGDSAAYDDGNIPEIDLPGASNATKEIPQEFNGNSIPKLDEDTRPRQDGPGGN